MDDPLQSAPTQDTFESVYGPAVPHEPGASLSVTGSSDAMTSRPVPAHIDNDMRGLKGTFDLRYSPTPYVILLALGLVLLLHPKAGFGANVKAAVG